jgi:CDGSH-type Zn-finger protein
VVARGSQRIRMMTVAEQTMIAALDNEPYLVKGPVVVVDAEGNRFPVERRTIALCRCGGSTNKPFCDGTHSKVGFRAAERAVREEEEQERLKNQRAFRQLQQELGLKNDLYKEDGRTWQTWQGRTPGS